MRFRPARTSGPSPSKSDPAPFLADLRGAFAGEFAQLTNAPVGDGENCAHLQGQSRHPLTQLSAQPPAGYWISVSSLNIGRYIAMMITPTTQPTAIIISGSMIDVRLAMAESTSSS
jgi:hypothetical protein